MAIDPKPVYEADQVVTIYDLIAIRNGYIYTYHGTPKWRLYRRWMLRTGVGVCDAIILWMQNGKPGAQPAEGETIQ